MNTFLVPDGRGGCGQLAQAGCPIRPWHRVYAPAAGEGCSLAWASPGLGLEAGGREFWLPEDEAGVADSEFHFGGFDQDPLPRWSWRLGELRIEVTLAPQHGEPAVAMRVEVAGARPGTRLLFRPAFTPWGPSGGRARDEAPPADTGDLALAGFEPAMGVLAGEAPGSLQAWHTGDRARFEVLHPEAKRVHGPAWDRRRRVSGWWFRPGGLALELPPGESTRDFRVGLDTAEPAAAEEIFEGAERRAGAAPRLPGHDSTTSRALSRALDRYRVRPLGRGFALLDRLPADGPPDSGAVWRALPGALLDFGMFDEAREALAAGARDLAAGSREADAAATGVDESAWEWVVAGHRFAQASGDLEFVRGVLWPVWARLSRAAPAPGPGPDSSASLRGASARHAAQRAMVVWVSGAAGEPVRGELERAAEAAASAARRFIDPVRAMLTERVSEFAPSVLTASAVLALDSPFSFLYPVEEQSVLRRVRELLWTPAGIRVAEPGGVRGAAHASLVLPSLLGGWLRAERRLDGCDIGLDERLAAARSFAATALAGPVAGHVCPAREAAAPHMPATGLGPGEIERGDLESDAATLSICG